MLVTKFHAPHKNSNPQQTGNQAATAIHRASKATGISFNYLFDTAMRESSLNTEAQAKTSSAAGLFQFIEQTWLGAVKNYGTRHGLKAEAEAITKDANGVYRVTDSNRRIEILNLRFDPNASANLAGELAGENKLILERHLGRAATSSDLYTAHFLGPMGAVALLSAPGNTKAADILSAAARANKHVFYDGARARSVTEVISSISKSIDKENVAAKLPVSRSSNPKAVFTAIDMLPSSTPQSDRITQFNSGHVVDHHQNQLHPDRKRVFTNSDLSFTQLSTLAMSILHALNLAKLNSENDRQNFDT
ncbi:MAG: hypothetical protein AAGD92_07135 [Pseudomonadota bacterium]